MCCDCFNCVPKERLEESDDYVRAAFTSPVPANTGQERASTDEASRQVLRATKEKVRQLIRDAKVLPTTDIDETDCAEFYAAKERFEKLVETSYAVLAEDPTYKPSVEALVGIREAIGDMQANYIKTHRKLAEMDPKCPRRWSKFGTAGDVLVGLTTVGLYFKSVYEVFIEHWFYSGLDDSVNGTTMFPETSTTTTTTFHIPLTGNASTTTNSQIDAFFTLDDQDSDEVISQTNLNFLLAGLFFFGNVASSRARDWTYGKASEGSRVLTLFQKVVSQGVDTIEAAKVLEKELTSRRTTPEEVNTTLQELKDSSKEGRHLDSLANKLNQRVPGCCEPQPIDRVNLADLHVVDKSFNEAKAGITDAKKTCNDALKAFSNGESISVLPQIVELEAHLSYLSKVLSRFSGINTARYDDDERNKRVRMWVQIFIECLTLAGIVYDGYSEIIGEPDDWIKLAILGVYGILFAFSRSNDFAHKRVSDRQEIVEHVERFEGLAGYLQRLSRSINLYRATQALSTKRALKGPDVDSRQEFKDLYGMVSDPRRRYCRNGSVRADTMLEALTFSREAEGICHRHPDSMSDEDNVHFRAWMLGERDRRLNQIIRKVEHAGANANGVLNGINVHTQAMILKQMTGIRRVSSEAGRVGRVSLTASLSRSQEGKRKSSPASESLTFPGGAIAHSSDSPETPVGLKEAVYVLNPQSGETLTLKLDGKTLDPMMRGIIKRSWKPVRVKDLVPHPDGITSENESGSEVDSSGTDTDDAELDTGRIQEAMARIRELVGQRQSKVQVGGNDSDTEEESDGYDSDTLVNTLVGGSGPTSTVDVVRNVATSVGDFFKRMTNTEQPQARGIELHRVVVDES